MLTQAEPAMRIRRVSAERGINCTLRPLDQAGARWIFRIEAPSKT
jgi:hypothetical protein